jgi:cell division protease FtsH
MANIIPIVIVLIIVAFVFVMLNNAQGASAGGSRMMNFGKSRAKLSNSDDNKIRLDDVAGLTEEKEQLAEIIEFLKSPGKFIKLGARIPKGVLLEGRPGTGKTLLAKAVAGEAGVPFFTISGSDFVEMFVGVGASRVRDLFEEAKKNAPCIIFIDEIDAVARRRGTGMGGGHDEREQTLNQLLVEMDGFGTNEGIIVMAATNRVDILDPAILRPGRFDRKITVSPPDVGGREAILKIHARNKKLGDDVDLKQVAQTTAGFTGADLENLLNEAAINTAMADRSFTNKEDIQKAFINVGIGVEKHSHIITDKEKKITAYHETGHAILFHVLPDVGPVYTVSIIPTGAGAAGYTMPLPEKDEMFLSRNRMLEDIMVSLGGRIAEEIIFGDITTGASSDIKKATHEARNMVTKYGMSKNIGVINYDEEEEDVFIGYDIAHNKKHSELMSGEIDKEVKAIIDACYKKAKEIILEYQDVLHKSAELLIEKEKIGRDEFEALFEGHEIPEDFNMEI